MTALLALKFKSLGSGDEDLNLLVQCMRRHAPVAAGSDIIAAGSTAGSLTVLLDGVACLYKRQEDGGRQIYSFQYAGDLCDLNRYALPDRDDAVAVQAITECSIATIAHSDIERLLMNSGTLRLALWRATMFEAGIIGERLLIASRTSALRRVANLLCIQLVRREVIGISCPTISLSQVDMADATGLSVVHVNRTVQTLRKMGILARTSGIEVKDRRGLARIANFDSRRLNMSRFSGWAVQFEEGPSIDQGNSARAATPSRRAVGNDVSSNRGRSGRVG